ncbi:MAG: NADH-quinone oxidoreductase subunit NuoF [Clostridiales bacterium]|nr:NADH-quinone oxidoreductase subunit NuoF [Clostridiales bacterium]
MKTVQELKEIRERMQDIVALRDNHKSSKKFKYSVMVCGGTGCTSSGSNGIYDRLLAEVEEAGIADSVQLILTGCFGLCALGPIVIVYPEGSFYCLVEPDGAERIVKEHLVGGTPVKDLLYHETVNDDGYQSLDETPFYKKQKRTALRNCGRICPENIDEYLAFDGYLALEKVLCEMKPEDVIKVITDSGLRGRGGGGFPTGVKWKFAAQNEAEQKYVCCNADEGDPGAFMDRSILEGDPHVILEAMAITGYAIGASEGYVYVRAEYPIAVSRFEIAIKQARAYGLLGKNIFGSGFDFDVHIKLGAGAFVCGEETALITSIEGNRGEPRPRPPFPAVKGLWGKPTVLNNVETYANIPQIILHGADWFNSMGTEKSKGTKVFALGGKIHNVGLVEVEMGTTLREIVEDIGGGVPDGKKFKAAQTGGPSGGCIPAEKLDVPIDYDNLTAIGSMMGSGGLIVMDEDNCMVDIAKFFLAFTVDESCGKCTPCRIGTKKLLDMLTDITDGRGKAGDIEKMVELSEYIRANSLCALGQTAPNPVLSTIHYFREEYEAHINEKRCPSGVCKNLTRYIILADKCKGCTLCARKCPNEAIEGQVKAPHVIDQDKCIKCGVCIGACKFGAVIKA